MIDSALTLLDANASADLTPLKLRGPASAVMRRYAIDLAEAFPDLRLRIRRLYRPEAAGHAEMIEGSAEEQAQRLFDILAERKLVRR